MLVGDEVRAEGRRDWAEEGVEEEEEEEGML